MAKVAEIVELIYTETEEEKAGNRVTKAQLWSKTGWLVAEVEGPKGKSSFDPEKIFRGKKE